MVKKDEDEEEEYSRGRRDPFRDFFGFTDIEKEFQKMQELADELMRRGLSDEERNPFVYGFSLKRGPDGTPKIQEFGNARGYFGKREQDEKTEWTPLTDVQDQGDEILVTVDIPGVEKEDIKLESRDHTLIIDVDGARRYRTRIDLPSEVEAGESEASYHNGVLEVKLKKKDQTGERIEIK